MSRRSPADVAALALLATTVGCATAGVREAVLLDPIVESSPPRGALPDESERMAGRVIALVFADRDDDATQAFQMLQGREWGLDERPTGLVDNAEALIQSTEGHLLFEDWARRALDRGIHDPALLLQLERYLESQPLTVARARLREDRARKLGGWANRLIAPAARFVQGAGNPLAAIRAALNSLLSIHAAPEATTQERQALRAYRDFVDRYPDTPGAVEAAKRIEHYDGKLRRQLGTDALAVAEAALEGGRPDIALMFIERAERLIPDDAADSEIRPQAEAQVALYEARIRRSLSASPEAGDPSAALVAPLLVASVEAAAKQAAASDTPSPRDDDELDFVSALPVRAQGREEEFLDAMGEIAEGDPETSEMARHAAVIVVDPEQNPYAYYLAADAAEDESIARWLFLGPFASGPRERGLPDPIEWLIDALPMAYAVAMTPLRALQYPGSSSQFGSRVLHSGERYLAHFPDGEHTEEVREDLEERYEARGQWTRALKLHEQRVEPDPDKIADYRERIADRSVDYAEGRPHARTRVEIYRAVANEYPETDAGKRATRLLGQELAKATPQSIRVSREFLEQNPSVWAPGALSLRPELMDGSSGNGELADPGVTLLGRTVVRLELEDEDPITVELPPRQFARFVAALEEASNRQLATDERENVTHDPQRDVFFERAKLGLLDVADLRPGATSHAVFLGSYEKFGVARRRDSILPVDVVLQGGLEDFGFAALPQVRIPRESPDAFLYR